MTEISIEWRNLLPEKYEGQLWVAYADGSVKQVPWMGTSGVVEKLPPDGVFYRLPPIACHQEPQQVVECSIEILNADTGEYAVSVKQDATVIPPRSAATIPNKWYVWLNLTDVSDDGILIVGTIDIFPGGE